MLKLYLSKCISMVSLPTITGPIIDATAAQNNTRPSAAPRSSNIFLRMTIAEVTYPPKVNPKIERHTICPISDVQV